MSIESTVRATLTAPRPLFLPKGLEQWKINASINGDASSGDAKINISFNPDGVKEETYLAITHLQMFDTAVSSMVTLLYVNGTQYQDMPSNLNALLTPPLAEGGNSLTSSSQATHITRENPYYLGATTATNNIQCRWTTNTNGESYMVVARGYRSKTPFVIPDWLAG